MGMTGMFAKVSRPAGTLIHKAVGEAGARYGSPNGGVGCGVGFDGARGTRCGKLLPRLGTQERAALQPPEDSALRWNEVNCADCRARKYVAPKLEEIMKNPHPFCPCGHGPEVHLKAIGGECSRCLELAGGGRCGGDR